MPGMNFFVGHRRVALMWSSTYRPQHTKAERHSGCGDARNQHPSIHDNLPYLSQYATECPGSERLSRFVWLHPTMSLHDGHQTTGIA